MSVRRQPRSDAAMAAVLKLVGEPGWTPSSAAEQVRALVPHPALLHQLRATFEQAPPEGPPDVTLRALATLDAALTSCVPAHPPRPAGTRRRSDRDLVAAAAHGDQGAWELLVDRYAQLVWDIARCHGLDERSAAQVCEVAWARLADHLAQLATGGHVRRWLTVAAREEARRASS